MSTVAVTGANGFIGQALLARLKKNHPNVIALLRDAGGHSDGASRTLPDLAELANGTAHADLAGIDVLVHCAAIPQSRKDSSADEREHLFAVNAGATRALAEQAGAAGVKRFVLISSAKVNGESTGPGKSFSGSDVPAPQDDYARSKLQAEQHLISVAASSAMETVIIRPPLVYGAGVKGNFAQLVRLSARGLPLPLGAVRNQRSMISVDNLADLITRAVNHPAAAGQVLMAGDAEDLSTPELIARLARLQGAPVHLVAVPPGLMRAALGMLGRQAIADRLMGSLRVDAKATMALLGWTPPLSVDAALQRTVASLNQNS